MPPVASILREIVGDQWEVVVLVPAGASPHTYAPRPSDAALTQRALALVSVGPSLDGWADRLPARERVHLINFVSRGDLRESDDHDHGTDTNPHFWLDPLTVKAMLPKLTSHLSELDPANRESFEENAIRFARELDALHDELSETLAHVRGEPAILFHPSFDYFLARYGLDAAGLIAPFPDAPPSPGHIQELVKVIRTRNVKAVFDEPDFSGRPVEVVAESAGVPVYTLDPLGGREGRGTYAELLRFNAGVFAEALQ
jgi:zinc transport system substrate-binding protein